MKDPQVQTLVSHRRLKSVADQAKKSQKISKNLSYAFDSASKHSSSVGPVTDVSESNPEISATDLTEISQEKEYMQIEEASATSPSSLSASSEKPSPLPSDLTPVSALTAIDDMRDYYSSDIDTGKSCDQLSFPSLETEVVVNILQRARVEISSSVDLDLRLKKLLDSLLMISIENLCSIPEERENRIYRNLSVGVRVAALCTMCLMFSLLLVNLIFSGQKSPPYYPPPT